MQVPTVKPEITLGNILTVASLLVILVTAISSYNSVQYEARQANDSLVDIRKKMDEETKERKQAVGSIQERYEAMTQAFTRLQLENMQRLGKIEGKQELQGEAIERIERSLDGITKRLSP